MSSRERCWGVFSRRATLNSEEESPCEEMSSCVELCRSSTAILGQKKGGSFAKIWKCGRDKETIRIIKITLY
jgi:hypothetical protein